MPSKSLLFRVILLLFIIIFLICMHRYRDLLSPEMGNPRAGVSRVYEQLEEDAGN